MSTFELSDIDGDALAVIADRHGVWITCTTEGDEVTVGPFRLGALDEALAAVGSYARIA